MYPKNERERALFEYGYAKGIAEAFERMLIRNGSVLSSAEYNESKTIKFNRED